MTVQEPALTAPAPSCAMTALVSGRAVTQDQFACESPEGQEAIGLEAKDSHLPKNLTQVLLELEETAQNMGQYLHSLHTATTIPALTVDEHTVLHKHINGTARPLDSQRLKALVIRIRLREAHLYEWVGLTDEEIMSLKCSGHDQGMRQFSCCQAIEKILKKKNGFDVQETDKGKSNRFWRKLTPTDLAAIPVPCFPVFSLKNNCRDEGAKMFARAIDATLMAKNYKPKSSLLRNNP
jgi:hypothetical protein